MGAPTKGVKAWGHLAEGGIDDSVSLLLEYESGGNATLNSSIVRGIGTGHNSSGIVLATGGWISVPKDIFCPEGYVIHRPDAEPIQVHRPKNGNGYIEEIAEATRCVRDGLTESPLVPLDDTVATMRVIDSVYQQIGLSYPATPTLPIGLPTGSRG